MFVDSTVAPGSTESAYDSVADSDSADTEGAILDEFNRSTFRLLVCNYVLAPVFRSDTDLNVISGGDLAVPSPVTVLDVG